MSIPLRTSLSRIKSLNPTLNAFVSVVPEDAFPPSPPSSQPSSPIASWTIALKDNIATTHLPTTCSSRLLSSYTSPFSSTVADLLTSAGAYIVGKTNMDEFGMGSHSLHSFYGAVKNPLNHELSAGGSSGGSAAAIRAEMCDAAIGTDTGGSVRLPASYCGVVGLKPSYGLISRWGVVAYANSLDTVGVLGKDVGSVNKVFRVLSKHDEKDPTSVDEGARERVQSLLKRHRAKGKLRAGLPLEFNTVELTPAARDAWLKVLQELVERCEYEVIPVSMPATKHALGAYYTLAPAEASSNLARYDGVRYGFRAEQDRTGDGALFSTTRGEGFGEEVKRRILLGTYSLSAEKIDNYFIQAQKVRRLVQRDFDGVFRARNWLVEEETESLENKDGGVDVLVAPTALGVAPKREGSDNGGVEEYVNDVLTVPASLVGTPSVSVPVETNEGWVGMQIMGQWGDEEKVMEVAEQVQELVKER